MIDPITFRASVTYNRKVEQNSQETSPNPLRLKTNLASLSALSNYNQVLLKHKNDIDCLEIMSKVRTINSFAPQKINLPHSYNINEINGERLYDGENQLVCVKQEGAVSTKYFYPDKNAGDENLSVAYIEEFDKDSGKLLAKFEPSKRANGSIKTNMTVFDIKENNKYTVFLLEEDGLVKTITEFSKDGAVFKSLYRNPETLVPIRYLESTDANDEDFSLTDCRFNKNGEISEIREVTSQREVLIKYDGSSKSISVKSFEN